MTDAASNVTQYAYDTENNLTSITDANNHATSFAYDAYGRVTQTTFPSTRSEAYVYDALGNLTSKTDRKSQTIQYVYDALNRVTHKGYPDSTGVDYVYDMVGRLQQVSDPTGTYGFAYDNMGRLLGTTTQYSFLAGTLSQAYQADAASNRTSATMPDGSSNQYQYDMANRLTDLTSSWAGRFTFGYDQLSRSTSMSRPNGINTSYQYDSVSRLLSVLHKAGTVTIDGATYQYDSAGNRTSKTNELAGVTDSYTYDLIYQLTQAVQGSTTTESYTYDGVGNRLSSLGVDPYSYNSSNQLTATPTATFGYDYNGNTTGKTDASGTTSYSWDFENRLTSVTLPGTGGTVTFKYDPFGRRIQKSGPAGTTTYVYDGANIVGEYSSSGTLLARYTQGAGVDQPLAMNRSGVVAYYNADGLGSVTSLIDTTNTPLATYRYDAFGNITNSGGTLQNPFQYTGREWDQETGVYYYRARYYDRSVGRFISEDPIGLNGDGTNFYRYALNNPIRFRDPSGLTVTCYYGQNTGQLICYNDANGQQVVNTTGYAGGNQGRTPNAVNNSDYQYLPNTGPLPWGDYRIGSDNGRMGPLSLPLTPLPGTNTDGRDGFYIHGDNRCGCRSGSEGCIVVPRGARQTINDLGGGIIMVSPTVGPPPGNYCQGGVCKI